MDKINQIQSYIDKIRSTEGTGFECDDLALTKEYQAIEDSKSNLAIKILSIFGALFAVPAFMAFLEISGLSRSKISLLFMGVILIVFAIWINKNHNKIITDTLSISSYIIGVILFAIGLNEFIIDYNYIVIVIALISLISLILTQNYILSFISILTINGSFLFLIFSNNHYNLIYFYIAINALILTYMFLKEAKIISTHQKLSRLYNPLRIGVIFSFLFGLVSIGIKNLIFINESFVWILSLVLISVALYLVYTIIKITEIKAVKFKVLIYIISTLILATTVFSPSITGAIIIVLLSFLTNHKTGFIIGIIALIYFISQYYYDLSFTLLTKSIMLLGSGVLFLFLYLFTSKKLSQNEKI